jgi:transposase InsO family protein
MPRSPLALGDEGMGLTLHAGEAGPARAGREGSSGSAHGPQRISAATGVPARAVSQILARHRVPRLDCCDPVTGQLIRASRATAARYERDRPGELVHVDVKKLGRIPDGGGWRAHGRSEEVRGRGIGYDYVHSAVDDRSRVAYSEIHPDERAPTCAAFMLRAAKSFAGHGVRIERVITDNALAYRRSTAFKAVIAQIGAEQRFIKPHCSGTDGKAERLNRTLRTEWAYAQPFASNHRPKEPKGPSFCFLTVSVRPEEAALPLIPTNVLTLSYIEPSPL